MFSIKLMSNIPMCVSIIFFFDPFVDYRPKYV